MINIFLISKNSKQNKQFEKNFKEQEYNYKIKRDTQNIAGEITGFAPDIVFIDSSCTNYENILKIVKSQLNESNCQIILLISNDTFKDETLPPFADGFLQVPLSENILNSAILSYFNVKTSLDKLQGNNKELSKSLYQINSLYNTSSQFSDTLQKDKLCNIMLEGLEKILSFDMASVLLFTNNDSATLHIKSIHELSPSLEEAIKIRLSLKYNNTFEDEKMPFSLNYNNIKTVKNIKNRTQTYDLKILNYDTLFAQIKVGENFFGVIEIVRQTPFLAEDVACFQTIINQVALPLRNATLYEEIKNANIKLEKLERLKSDFVSIVSHELRTPLTPINNSLEIVLSGGAGDISEDAKNFINMAKRNVSRLSAIIEDLLDLSRVQMGKLDYKFKKTNLQASLELVYKTFTQSAKEKNMDFALLVENKDVEIYADTRRIEQILSNIVSNALKFTPDGGKISINVKKEAPSGDFIDSVDKIADEYLKISIEDNGIGMLKEDIAKIFDQFSQIESSLTRNKGGIGLGLAITKQLIDAHFGLINVESEKDKGSMFNIYFPIFSEKTAFLTDMSDLISKNENIGIFFIRQNKSCEFLNYLTKTKMLKKTQGAKELTLHDEKHDYYWLCAPHIEISALSFIENTIKNELNEDKWKKCDIMLECASKKNIKKMHQIIDKLDLLGEENG